MRKIYNRRVLLLIDIISVGGAMIGSLLLALNDDSWSKYGYIFFMVGTIASIVIMLQSNIRRSQVLISGWFLCANTVGIIRWFGFFNV